MFENVKTPISYVGEIESHKIWMMREDLLPFSFGGNKARIADKFVQDFKQSDKTIMVGYGNARSNLSRILVNLCAKEGIPCCLISPQDDDGHTEKAFNCNIVQSFGTEIFKCKKSEVPQKIPEVISLLKERGERPYYIYSPHHIAIAVSAYVEAYSHISEWEKANVLFDHIYLACGTGMTLAGLICGEWFEKKWESRITGISVARKAVHEIPILQNYVNKYCEWKRKPSFLVSDSVFDDRFLQGAYGVRSQIVDETVEKMFQKYGIPMDYTYTGRAFCGMLRHLKEEAAATKKILFVHTGGTPLFFDTLSSSRSPERLPYGYTSKRELSEFLRQNSSEFAVPLMERIDIEEYSEKVLKNGYVFVVRKDEKIVGAICGYANDKKRFQAYLSILVVSKESRGTGVAKRLFDMQLRYCRLQGMTSIFFTTNRKNHAAIRFYEKMNVPQSTEKSDDMIIAYVLPLRG